MIRLLTTADIFNVNLRWSVFAQNNFIIFVMYIINEQTALVFIFFFYFYILYLLIFFFIQNKHFMKKTSFRLMYLLETMNKLFK